MRQVTRQLELARSLRRQKSTLFTSNEEDMFEDTFQHTEHAVHEVLELGEPPAPGAIVSAGRRKRDVQPCNTSNIQVSLTRLGIASQGLHSTLVQLNDRGAQAGRSGPSESSPSLPSGYQVSKSPPTYEESQFLSEGRRRNIQRRASAAALGLTGSPFAHERYRPCSSQSIVAPSINAVQKSVEHSTLRFKNQDLSIPELSIPELAADESYFTPS